MFRDCGDLATALRLDACQPDLVALRHDAYPAAVRHDAFPLDLVGRVGFHAIEFLHRGAEMSRMVPDSSSTTSALISIIHLRSLPLGMCLP